MYVINGSDGVVKVPSGVEVVDDNTPLFFITQHLHHLIFIFDNDGLADSTQEIGDGVVGYPEGIGQVTEIVAVGQKSYS